MIVVAPAPARVNGATLNAQLAAVPGVTEVRRVSMRTSRRELEVELGGEPDEGAVRAVIAAHTGEPTAEEQADTAERGRLAIQREEAQWARAALANPLGLLVSERALARLTLRAWRDQQSGQQR